MTAELPGSSTTANASATACVADPRSGLHGRSLPPLPRTCRFHQRHRGRGFTLTELVVTVGIAGVLLALGAPALSEMMAAQRVKTATVDFYTSLAYARSEAIKRNAVVTVTPR